MKKILFVFIFGFISILAFSAPFGLKMGMTIDEIAEQCKETPIFLENDIYLINPIKNHPLFSYYAVHVDDKTGLYQIQAVSDSVNCNKYGSEIQNAFYSVKDRIAKTYGNPKIIKKVDTNIPEYYQKDECWFMTLKDGSRVLSAIWGEQKELADNLISVALECVAEDGVYNGTARLILYYHFTNRNIVEDEQDSVF